MKQEIHIVVPNDGCPRVVGMAHPDKYETYWKTFPKDYEVHLHIEKPSPPTARDVAEAYANLQDDDFAGAIDVAAVRRLARRWVEAGKP